MKSMAPDQLFGHALDLGRIAGKRLLGVAHGLLFPVQSRVSGPLCVSRNNSIAKYSSEFSKQRDRWNNRVSPLRFSSIPVTSVLPGTLGGDAKALPPRLSELEICFRYAINPGV